ncbi:C40 family peptidase [Exiguobacterium sp. SH5S4]|uniref:C40 family peptidase n=1 Tax=Exiguobacterium sp. SH5S4 TaxID=2510961 RepID=UPI001F466802|nr:SH3 domain-containing protein [Exiguobacterium sp. SH5S4]
MNHKSGLMYSFAAIAAVSVLAQADEASAASTHIVRAGDTLWSISQQHQIPLATLKSMNNLTTDRIAIGQTLNLAGSPTVLTTTSTAVSKNRVTTAALNLRAGAGTSHNVLLTIPKGQTLKPLKTSGKWSQVTFNGKTGWVHNDYLGTAKAATTKPTASTSTVSPTAQSTSQTTVNLNLRASKSTKANVLVTIPKGKTVTILKVEGSWSHIKYGSTTGFVATTYLKKAAATPSPSQPATPSPSQPATPAAPKEESVNQSFVTTANLNVRKGAGIGFALVTTIPNGATVQATKQSGTWYYVTYNGKSGYVSAGYLKQTTTAPSAPVAPNLGDAGAGNTSVDYVVNTPSLNVRAAASTSSAIVGSVKAGQTLRVVQTANGWHQIYIGNTTGFVAASFVKEVPKSSTTAPTWVSGSFDSHTFYTASPAAIRAQANDSSQVVGSTLRGGLLNVVGETATHYRVNENGTQGFVAKAFVTQVNGQTAQATRLATIAVAKKYVGTPYIWASSSPVNGGFDCSGIIYYAFNQAGVSIPRTNVANYWAGSYFGPQLDKSFVPQAGDLVFFENTYTAGPSHMGIMIDADTFIHAGTFGLGYNQISKEPYWKSRLIGYKRP